MSRSSIIISAIAMFAAGVSFAQAAEHPKVVVELFTSQGCSSCPPANANLIKLNKRPDVLTLSFSVTYWDYLGWKDSFGKKEFTDRQVVYEPGLGKQGPFTPQMVFNGATTAVGQDLGEIQGLVDDAAKLEGPDVTLSKTRVKVGGMAAGGKDADVWLVHYQPSVVEVPIERGENTGETLPHVHVVHALERLGSWDGKAVSYDLPAEPKGLKTAILVQQQQGGPILSVVTD